MKIIKKGQTAPITLHSQAEPLNVFNYLVQSWETQSDRIHFLIILL